MSSFMHCLRAARLFLLVCPWLFVSGSVWGQARTLMNPLAEPAQARIGQATTVRFTVDVSDTTLQGINLLRVGAAGTNPTIVATLRDDGQGGDEIAGDGRYSVEITLTEPAATTVIFRLSAAFKGVLQRVQSPDIPVQVVANRTPVAIPGINENAKVGTVVVLDGRQSYDLDGDLLRFRWQLLKPANSNASLDDTSLVKPAFTPDVAGTYQVQLVVNDGFVDSAVSTLTVQAYSGNTPPTAVIGGTLSRPFGNAATATVALNSTGSSDPEGSALTAKWQLISRPASSVNANLDSTTSASPNLTADKPGRYVVQLIVNDGTVDSLPVRSTITLYAPNTPPLANAGADRTVTPSTLVTLQGNASDADAGDTIASLRWSFIEKPSGSAALLSNPTTATPSFTPDLQGDYLVELVATDSRGAVGKARVVIRATGPVDSDGDGVPDSIDQCPNTPRGARVDTNGCSATQLPPVTITALTANPASGPVPLGVNFTSQASGGAGGFTYGWTFGDNATSTQQNPQHTYSTVGDYTAQVTATDLLGSSATGSVVIHAQTVSPSNRAPVVSAGQNQTIALAASASLSGAATDDGLPNPPGALTLAWSKRSGPGIVSFTNANALSTSATFDAVGVYVLQLSASDGALTTTSDVTVTVIAANRAPVVSAGANQTITLPAGATINGAASDDGLPNPPGALSLMWTRVSGPGTATFANAGSASTTVTFGTPGIHVLRFTASDGLLSTSADVQITVNADPNEGLPPNPVTIASAITDQTNTDHASSTAFLYASNTPVQTGVSPGAIGAQTAGTLHGRVLDGNGAPLPGVMVKVLNAPQYGQTLSRADGEYDLVVNGGGAVVLTFARFGYLPAQRRVTPDWQEYRRVPDLRLVQPDTTSSSIDLGAAVPVQIARATTRSDADGARTSRLFFKQGTTASLLFANGSTQPIAHLTVRQTEYTVGDDGPQRMPAQLPPSTAYTYAAALTVDEAIAAGAISVQFNQPVINYVEGFLPFPVGQVIPAGAYDEMNGVWTPSSNGRVIKVLGITGGLADVDVDGDGLPDTGSKLADLGMDTSERMALANTYAAGQVLWRVPVTHFTPYDYNWPFVIPANAMYPPPNAQANNQPNTETRKDCPVCVMVNGVRTLMSAVGSMILDGSIIESENQILQETVPIAGTGLSLNYSTANQAGFKGNNTIVIPIADGRAVPADLKRIDLAIEVAGRYETYTFLPSPNQSFTYTFDGLDRYGRQVHGAQPIRATVEYVYPLQYAPSRADFASAWAAVPEADARVIFASSRASREFKLAQVHNATVVAPIDPAAIGGWTVSAHHVYDPTGQTLYMGDGSRRSEFGSKSEPVIDLFVGGAEALAPGVTAVTDMRPIRWAAISQVFAHNDGSIYVRGAPWGQVTAIWRIAPDGRNAQKVLGNDQYDPCVDGTLALNCNVASLNTSFVVLASGEIVFQPGDYATLWKVGLDGRVRRVAGTLHQTDATGLSSFQGGRALNATFHELHPSLATDGTSVYFVTNGERRAIYIDPITGLRMTTALWQLLPDGNLVKLGESGDCSLPGYQGNPYEVPWECSQSGFKDSSIIATSGVAVTREGVVRILHNYGAEGIRDAQFKSLSRYNPPHQSDRRPPDPAVSGLAAFPITPSGNQFHQLAAGPRGELYLWAWPSQFAPSAVLLKVDERAAQPQLIVTRAAGNGLPNTVEQMDPHGASATSVGFVDWSYFNGPTVAPDGTVYLIDDGVSGNMRRILRMKRRYPTFAARGDIVLPSPDGSVLYRFDQSGRHLDTRNSLTGAVLLTFGYDSAGRLATVTDADNNVTQFNRNASGRVTTIVAPFGQVTNLTYDGNNQLVSVRNPANEVVQYGYAAGRLLTSMTTPRGHTYQMTYDAQGRLLQDSDPAGGSKSLVKTVSSSSDYTIQATTALGRQLQRRTEDLGTTRRITTTAPDGTITVGTVEQNQTVSATLPDGSEAKSIGAPDPRFGMLGAFSKYNEQKMPSGLTMIDTMSRSVVAVDASNLLAGVASLNQTAAVNGRTASLAYSGATGVTTATSPTGRITTTFTDAVGRILNASFGGLAPVAVTYDARGRVSSITHGQGAAARTTSVSYDVAGFLQSVTDALGRVTNFSHDAVGRPLSVMLPDGRVVSSTYDPNGNVASIRPPGRPPYAFAHSPVDLGTQYDPPDVAGVSPDISSATYNADRQLTSLTRPDAKMVTVSYDAGGRIASVGFSRGALGISYAPSGVLASLTTPGGISHSFTYDGSLLMSHQTTGPVPAILSWTYDNDFRAKTQSINGGSTVSYAYDADGLPTQVGGMVLTRDRATGLILRRSIGSLAEDFTYNSFAELTAHVVKFNNTTTLYGAVLTRDGIGRITRKVETFNGVSDTYDYTYDVSDRLLTVTKNSVLTSSYAYDQNGNRSSYDGSFGTVPSAQITVDPQDRMTRYGATTFAYNAAGDLTTQSNGTGTTTFSYDEAGNLMSAQLAGSSTVTYTIDALQRRIGRSVGAVLSKRWVYDGRLAIVAELDATNSVDKRFVYARGSNVPDYMTRAGNTYLVVADYLGSVRLVVDAASGAVVAQMNHDEFGRVLQDTNPGFVPFGFAGGLSDELTGLVRFGARDYDPSIGRWTTPEPLRFAGSLNFYAYPQDPINNFDPTGLKPAPVYNKSFGVQAAVQLFLEGNVGASFVKDSSGNYAVQFSIGLGGGLGEEVRGGVAYGRGTGKAVGDNGIFGFGKGVTRGWLDCSTQIAYGTGGGLGVYYGKDEVHENAGAGPWGLLPWEGQKQGGQDIVAIGEGIGEHAGLNFNITIGANTAMNMGSALATGFGNYVIKPSKSLYHWATGW